MFILASLPGILLSSAVLVYFLWHEVSRDSLKGVLGNKFIVATSLLNLCVIASGVILICVNAQADEFWVVHGSKYPVTNAVQFLEFVSAGCHVHLLDLRLSPMLTPVSRSHKFFQVLKVLAYFFLAASLINTIVACWISNPLQNDFLLFFCSFFLICMCVLDVFSTYSFFICMRNMQAILKEQKGVSSFNSMSIIASIGIQISCVSLTSAVLCIVIQLFDSDPIFFSVGYLLMYSAGNVLGIQWMLMKLRLEKKSKTGTAALKAKTLSAPISADKSPKEEKTPTSLAQA
jgi:hypothetical protein